MKSRTFIQFLAISLISALLIGMVTVWALRTLTESGSSEFRHNNALSLATVLEEKPLEGAIELFRNEHSLGHLMRFHIWVVDERGNILASNNPVPLPERWGYLPHPTGEHEIGLAYRFLSLTPSATVIRLAGTPVRYAILTSPRDHRNHRHELMETLLVGSALAFSALIAMLMVFVYLRVKSREARAVLLRLERGDLKARFPIRQFDQVGSLMLDFNRMAAEIERLVERLAETEQARRSIFQELSHDLRTPLTSLRTSIDTLALHWREMTDEDRSEVLAVSQTETAYFMELMESLLFMAQMDEPRYKKSTQQVSLLRLVEEELRIRQATELARSSEVRWELDQRDPKVKAMIAGDPHLLRRLIKNALENAARFASSRVKLRLWEQVDTVVLQIEDDGPGMTPEEISQFGKTRSRRLVNPRGASHVSLGLGSVIMIKILAIHQGTLEIKSAGGISQGGSATGTQLEIRLPRSLSDEETE